MKGLIKKVGKLFKDKNFKHIFLWPLFLLLIGTFLTFLINYLNERENKRSQLEEKKLMIINELTESYQKLSYYSSYTDLINFEKIVHMRYFVNSKNRAKNAYELSTKESTKLNDTIKTIFPTYFKKMEEGEVAMFPFLKNIQLTKLFFSHTTHLKIDSLMECFPSEKIIQNSIASKLKDTCCISEKQKIKILVSIQKKRDEKFSNLLESMVRETK